MRVVYGFLTAFVVLSLISTILNVVRVKGNDSWIIKSVNIFSSLLAIGAGLISLCVFSRTCFDSILHFIRDSYGYPTYIYGPAFGLLAVSICLLFVEIVSNVVDTFKATSSHEDEQGTELKVSGATNVQYTQV